MRAESRQWFGVKQVRRERPSRVVEQRAGAQVAAAVVADERELGDGLREVQYGLASAAHAREVDVARAGGADAGGLRDDRATAMQVRAARRVDARRAGCAASHRRSTHRRRRAIRSSRRRPRAPATSKARNARVLGDRIGRIVAEHRWRSARIRRSARRGRACAAGSASATRSAAAPGEAISTRAVRPPSGAAIQASSDNGIGARRLRQLAPEADRERLPLAVAPGHACRVVRLHRRRFGCAGRGERDAMRAAPADIEQRRRLRPPCRRDIRPAAPSGYRSPPLRRGRTAAGTAAKHCCDGRRDQATEHRMLRFTRSPVNQGVEPRWSAPGDKVQCAGADPPPDRRPAHPATAAARSRTLARNASSPARRTPAGAPASGSRRS